MHGVDAVGMSKVVYDAEDISEGSFRNDFLHVSKTYERPLHLGCKSQTVAP